jgi:multidrug efflux pump
MILSDVSIRRPVFAAVLSMLISIAGIVAFLGLTVREYPDVEQPTVTVQTTYPGAAAAVMESRITQVLEDRLAGIEGIDTITSRSRDGQSDITIEFVPTRDIDSAANDVRDRVSGAVDQLPLDAEPPEIQKTDSDAQPIMYFSISAPPGWTRLELYDWTERVFADRLSAVNGVALVNVLGGGRPSMRIWLDPAKLAAFGLTPGDVETALESQNVELPAGRIEAESQNLTVRVDRPFATAEDFRRLVVRRGDSGYLVRLGDIARVEVDAENLYSAFRANGQEGLGVAIVKQSAANTLDVANAAKAVVDEMRPGLPRGMTIDTGGDTSLFIDRAIKAVYETVGEAAILVVVVIFLFLGSLRATLIPSITVPICLVATFAVLWMLGYTVNLLTLLALVLSIGIVVDDAIVVLENIYHRVEEGEDPLAASFLGARQVGFAIISTTAVVCIVFVPVMFLQGSTGLLFRELAAAMIGAVAFSGLLALTLVPMLCSKLLKKQERGRIAAWVDDRFGRIEARYGAALGRAMGRPVPIFLGVAALVTVAGGLFTIIPAQLAPPEDTGVIFTQLSATESTGFAELNRQTLKVESQIQPLVSEDGPVRRTFTRVPGFGAGNNDFVSASVAVFLRTWEERPGVKTQDVVNQINAILRDMPGLRGNAASPSSLGRGRSNPINFVIAGNSYPELIRARDRIIAAADARGGFINLDADYKETKPQLVIDVDTVRAGDLGVSVAEVSAALQTMMGSRTVTTYIQNGEEYDVIVQAEPGARVIERDLGQVQVRTASGALVPLANLITLRDTFDARELGRFNKMRAITLTGGLEPGESLAQALAFLEEQAAASPEVTAVGYRGESQAYREASGSIYLIFLMTIVIVYLVLAAQFESFVHPLVIIGTVPLAVAGGLIGLAAMGQSFNLFSQIGMIMLVGLAAKNGILIVEFANQLRDEGVAFMEAIARAATRRLRPILMTSIATVAGAVPLMIASGAGAAARRSIGTVVVWGVSIATVITLFLIPLLYVLLARNTGSPHAVSRKLEEALGHEGQG